MALGRKTGGRQKGSTKILLERRGNRLIIKASERIRQILEGKLPCSVCRGVGKTKYQPKGSDGLLGMRTCQSCYGSKFEQLSPDLIARVALSVREEAYPKLKAIEHTGKIEAGQRRVEVIYLDARPQIGGTASARVMAPTDYGD